jgi:hypothetical protein
VISCVCGAVLLIPGAVKGEAALPSNSAMSILGIVFISPALCLFFDVYQGLTAMCGDRDDGGGLVPVGGLD